MDDRPPPHDKRDLADFIDSYQSSIRGLLTQDQRTRWELVAQMRDRFEDLEPVAAPLAGFLTMMYLAETDRLTRSTQLDLIAELATMYLIPVAFFEPLRVMMASGQLLQGEDEYVCEILGLPYDDYEPSIPPGLRPPIT